MALSTRTKKILTVAMADKTAAEEMASAIDSGSNPEAANVAELGDTSDLTPLDTEDTYSDAAVNALVTEAEARLDAIEAKIDELIAALVAAGLMADS